jgi:hypothetical protein
MDDRGVLEKEKLVSERTKFESTGLGRFREVRVKGEEGVSWMAGVLCDMRDGTVFATAADTTANTGGAYRMTRIDATGWESISTNGWVGNSRYGAGI